MKHPESEMAAWEALQEAMTPVAVLIQVNKVDAPDDMDRGQKHTFLMEAYQQKATLIEAFMQTRPEVFGTVKFPLAVTVFGMIKTALTPEQTRVLKTDFLNTQDWFQDMTSGTENELQGF